MTQRLGEIVLEQRRKQAIERYTRLGFPGLVAAGTHIDNLSALRIALYGPPATLDEVEVAITRLEQADPRGYAAWEADFDRRRREQREAEEQAEAARIRRIMGGF